MGTRMNTAMIDEITRDIRSPSNWSRTTATVTVRGPAAPRPHTKRLANRSGRLGASAVITAPTA